MKTFVARVAYGHKLKQELRSDVLVRYMVYLRGLSFTATLANSGGPLKNPRALCFPLRTRQIFFVGVPKS